MKRPFFLSVVVIILALAIVPFVAGQNATESRTQFDPNTASNGTVGARLIVWSEFQKPRPLVDPAATYPANSDQRTSQAARVISNTLDRRPEANSQIENSHSSSSNKVEPGGR
jgi:hypothetical protein